MKTIKKIWSVLRQCLIIPLQILGGLIMAVSIFVFGIATLIESPAAFVVKWQIATKAIAKIWTDLKLKRAEARLNTQYNGELNNTLKDGKEETN